MAIKELKPLLPKIERLYLDAKDSYYNKGEYLQLSLAQKKLLQALGLKRVGSDMTDTLFDQLEHALQEISPKSAALKTVRAPTKNKKVEVKLPYPMPSLEKVKPESNTFDKWLTKIGRSGSGFIVMDKLDGVSLELVYGKRSDGLPNLYIGGELDMGNDVSYLAPHLKLPRVKSDIALRAEILVSKSNFKKWDIEVTKKEGHFKNARNMVSGVTNRTDIHPSLVDHDVVVYEALNPRGVPSKMLEKAKSMGFKVVPYKVYPSLTQAKLVELLKLRKAQSRYDIDGLVVAANAKTPIQKTANAGNAFAFKMQHAEDVVNVQVLGIDWQVSRYGQLKPVVRIQPVKLQGVTIRNVTAHNAKTVVDKGIGKGATVKITRSGDVIPYIVDVVKKAKPELPPQSVGKYKWNANKVDLVLVNPKQHSDVQIKSITEFFRQMGVDFLGEGIVERLIDDGLDTVGKIIRASKARLMKVEGFQARLAEKLWTNIQAAVHDADLAQLMSASGAFGQAFGRRRLDMLVNEYPNILKLKDPYSAALDIRGFSEILAHQFAKGLPKFLTWLSKHPEVTYMLPKKERAKGSAMKGQSVCFTGVRDTEVEQWIKSQGGTIASGVSRTTTVLVLKDKSSSSSKSLKADELGIKKYTLDEFKRKFKI